MLARLALASALLLACPALRAQAVSRAYCGDDKRAHVVFKNGTTKAVPPEAQQVGCDAFSIAADAHTVGWSALFDNYGTSYPIALTLALFRNGKKIAISPNQMIFEWRFVGNGEDVAVLSGPVHGGASVASLYDSRLGKRLETWNGTGTPPEWAKAWKDQFQD